jgi:16S rRNA (cytosine967-C5)-methyltransferase
MGPQSHRAERPVVVTDGTASRKRPNRSPKSTADAGPFVPGLQARKAAAKLLAAVIDAKTPLDGLTDHEHGHPQFRELDMRDRALVRAILVTALRFRVTIERLIARRLDRPLPANAHSLSHLLHVAAAQILFLDIPDSAAVNLAVTQAKSDPRTQRFAGLVNGVLRGIARAKNHQLPKMLAATSEAPAWFAERLTAAYGEGRTRAILGMHRIEAPVDFTVKSDRQAWAEKLGGIVLPTGTVRVKRLAANVADLPGYGEGAWWVQDAAAALPAQLLGDVAGLRVADLCAAPGGKTAQLVAAGAHVTAVDMSKNRLARLAANLERLGLTAAVVQADLLNYQPEQLFDAVLLDAPCSSTGTVRRHPDVPWTKSSEDIVKLAALQRKLLDKAITLVKPGGRLVFSNCSLDPEEGESLVETFLMEAGAVTADPVASDEIGGIAPFITGNGALRTTPADLNLGDPGISGLDGFFAARFRRLL